MCKRTFFVMSCEDLFGQVMVKFQALIIIKKKLVDSKVSLMIFDQ